MNPQEIISRLGVDAVLLPVRKGTKHPSVKEWQNTTFQDTRHPAYQASVTKAGAIGVLLGEPSQGLCSIDFDEDLALEEFLKANPALQVCLRTKGKRGANIWVILDGVIPPSRKLKSGGKDIGEWRAKGNHTLIAGIHPDGGEYFRLVDASPARLRYEDIAWPFGDTPSPPPSLSEGSECSGCSEYSKASEGSEVSVESPFLHHLHPSATLGDRIKASAQARKELASHPQLKKLYDRFIENRFTPAQGRRNSDLIEMVTFLFRAVSISQLEALVGAFYDLNQDVFRDSREQHMREAMAHVEACRIAWLDELPREVRECIPTLPADYQAAFGICLDLAKLDDKRCKPSEFFLSYNELGDRLGLRPKRAQRILHTFEAEGWLRIIQKGTQHKKGALGKATFYAWLLPLAAAAVLLFSFHQFFYTLLGLGISSGYTTL